MRLMTSYPGFSGFGATSAYDGKFVGTAKMIIKNGAYVFAPTYDPDVPVDEREDSDITGLHDVFFINGGKRHKVKTSTTMNRMAEKYGKGSPNDLITILNEQTIVDSFGGGLAFEDVFPNGPPAAGAVAPPPSLAPPGPRGEDMPSADPGIAPVLPAPSSQRPWLRYTMIAAGVGLGSYAAWYAWKRFGHKLTQRRGMNGLGDCAECAMHGMDCGCTKKQKRLASHHRKSSRKGGRKSRR